MSRRKDRSSLGREENTQKSHETVLIVCEGEKTERYYFEDLRRCEHLTSIDIISSNHPNPDRVVNEAIEKKEKYDKVYCVIDRDTHEKFDKAIEIAEEHNIEMIISYPCFEYWYLCHFKFCRSPISSCKNCTSNLKKQKEWQNKFPGDYSKDIKDPFSKLKDKLVTALTNARKSLEDAE